MFNRKEETPSGFSEKELKEIENDFKAGLANAGQDSKEENTFNSGAPDAPKPSFVVSDNVAKLFCDVKNGLEARIIEKYLANDLDDELREIIRNELRTKDKEIKIYKALLEQMGEQYLPEQHKEWVQKILLSPMVLAIECEIEKVVSLLQKIRKTVRDSKKNEVA